MRRSRHRSSSLSVVLLLGCWRWLANGFVGFGGTGIATGPTAARTFPPRYPTPGATKPIGGTCKGATVSPRLQEPVARSPNTWSIAVARTTRPMMGFLPNRVPWQKPRSSEGAAVRDGNASNIRSSSKTSGDGHEICGGGSGPPRSRRFGRWGGGGGDGDDGEERFGDEEGWGQERERLAALGAAQAMTAGRRSRYASPYRRQARRPRNDYHGNGPFTMTNALTALNVIVFMFQTRYPSITRAGWKLAPAIVQRGQWYRLITPVVLHGSLTHLLVNTMSFSSVGPLVERVLGSRKFLTVYVVAGIAGNVLSCVVNPRLPAVGASGAIFGMVGAWAAFCMMNESVMGRANSQRALKSVAQTVMINVVYGMSSSQIDNMGHLGGFLGGAVATFLIGPRLRRRVNPYTGEMYTVDVSPKLSLPWLRRKTR